MQLHVTELQPQPLKVRMPNRLLQGKGRHGGLASGSADPGVRRTTPPCHPPTPTPAASLLFLPVIFRRGPSHKPQGMLKTSSACTLPSCPSLFSTELSEDSRGLTPDTCRVPRSRVSRKGGIRLDQAWVPGLPVAQGGVGCGTGSTHQNHTDTRPSARPKGRGAGCPDIKGKGQTNTGPSAHYLMPLWQSPGRWHARTCSLMVAVACELSRLTPPTRFPASFLHRHAPLLLLSEHPQVWPMKGTKVLPP